MFQYLGINESDPVAGVNLKALEGQNGGKDHISQGLKDKPLSEQ